MRILGLSLCIVGVVIATLATFAYLSDIEAAGIACMVLGGSLFLIGAMMFIADVVLQLARRSIRLDFRCDLVRFHVSLHAEFGKPSGSGNLEDLSSKPSSYDRDTL